MVDLEEPHIGVAMRLVVGDGLQLPGKQRGTQDRLLGVERIGEGHPVLGKTRLGEIAGGEERHRQRFVASRTEQHVADESAVLLVLTESAGVVALGHGAGDVLVPEHATDLFGDVGFGGGVPSPSGYDHIERVTGQRHLEPD